MKVIKWKTTSSYEKVSIGLTTEQDNDLYHNCKTK